MDLKKAIGFDASGRKPILEDPFLFEYVNLKLNACGLPAFEGSEQRFRELTQPLLKDYREKRRLLSDQLCPVDQRIQDFITEVINSVGEYCPRLPSQTLNVDRHGMSRILSMPPDADKFESDIIHSYRVQQGIINNPKHDRRTTKGSFHVTDYGFPVPADKKQVPVITFARMLKIALEDAPNKLLQLPFTSTQEEKAETWVSLMLRPMVCPEVPGYISKKTMETRFFVPGNLVSNLDFVESIFGNAGDPNLPENDSAIDVEHWTGHTGCVILAPHLLKATKKQLGLPHESEATDRQKRDGLFWKDESELYNDGTAFKLTCRSSAGVVVSLIADNYYGYCKKEVKTQISFAANNYGLCEEEHAGGAIAFPAYDLGEDFIMSDLTKVANKLDHSFDDFLKKFASHVDIMPEGYAVDKVYKDIIYVPEDAYFTLVEQRVVWEHKGEACSIRLQPDKTYVLPSGYKIEMQQPHEGRRWRLVGTVAEGTYCHKPSTVSGGGKSEISKPITDAILTGPVFVADFQADFDKVDEILNKEYGNRYNEDALNKDHGRSLLSKERSLGSVVKLLTPHHSYTEEYNEWLATIPHHVKELVFVIKRFYKPDWAPGSWRERFSVDTRDGTFGNELKYRENRLATSYARVGFTEDGHWRTFSLRKDFMPATKLQTEDDISASIVVPANSIDGLSEQIENPSIKFIENCEYRLFQRPDECIHRGYDKAAEYDIAQPGNFLSNYEPLDMEQAKEIMEDTIRFEQYTQPVKDLFNAYMESDHDYIVSSAHPRIVDGKPTKNPRYLQDRGDLTDPRRFYLAEVCTRMIRKLGPDSHVPRPVNAVLPGRRNNPPDGAIPPLCSFNPIHFMELPELFMEFISSMTGKSPSTTGAGSEGAMTKGPFNMLCTISDLNAALLSFIVTGYNGFITAAGYVGPNVQVDHDISILIPEVWSRMKPSEREPEYLIKNGYLERCEDFEHKGENVPASLLGYRITEDFVKSFFGRIFANPASVITEEMLKPELQSEAIFADAMDAIIVTHKKVAKNYFDDGSIEGACPPLKALLYIMAEGSYEGKTLNDPEIRKLFDRDVVMGSSWYQERLHARQQADIDLWHRHVDHLKTCLEQPRYSGMVDELEKRLDYAKEELKKSKSMDFLKSLEGTLGKDPWLD